MDFGVLLILDTVITVPDVAKIILDYTAFEGHRVLKMALTRQEGLCCYEDSLIIRQSGSVDMSVPPRGEMPLHRGYLHLHHGGFITHIPKPLNLDIKMYTSDVFMMGSAYVFKTGYNRIEVWDGLRVTHRLNCVNHVYFIAGLANHIIFTQKNQIEVWNLDKAHCGSPEELRPVETFCTSQQYIFGSFACTMIIALSDTIAAIGLENGGIVILDVTTLKFTRLQRHIYPINGLVALSKHCFASSSKDQLIRLWQLNPQTRTYTVVKVIECPHDIYTMVGVPYNRVAVACGTYLTIYE